MKLKKDYNIETTQQKINKADELKQLLNKKILKLLNY